MATVAQFPAGAVDAQRFLGWLAVASACAVAVVGLQTPARTGEATAAEPRDVASAGVASAEVAPPPVLFSPLPEAGPPVIVHEVVAGDTLSGIASWLGLGVDELRAANSLGADDVLAVGQRLVLPEVAAAE